MEAHRRTEKVVSMVEKLKQGALLKRGDGGPSTPPPSWRLELPSSSFSMHNACDDNNNNKEEFLNFLPSISARKLCAKLWEIQPHQHTPLARMNKTATRLRRRRRRKPVAAPPYIPSDQPESASSLRRHVAASLDERCRSVDSYRSILEVAPHDSAATPMSSADFKGTIADLSRNRTTSAELLKVLNRIWSLEEQNASNVSAVKALKVELDRSQAWMKELLREKQMNKKEMENLMKQTAMDQFAGKNKEYDRVKAVVRSMEEELENERRLRRHSESLHRKLSRELSEVRSSLSDCLRALERERKARILLENLCDEFAKGIRDYEQEVHFLRRNLEKGLVKGNDNSSLDRLILHISEAWLDEQMQMKLSQSGNDLSERNSIVDKLGFDIEMFLRSKQSIDLRNFGYSSKKEAMNAPQEKAGEGFAETDFLEPKRANGEGDEATHWPQEIDGRTFRMTSTHSYDDENQIWNSSLSSESGDKVHPESVCKEDSCVTADSSPVKPRKLKSAVLDLDEPECSTKLPKGVKENTLMAKLLEARLAGQKSRSKSRKSTS